MLPVKQPQAEPLVSKSVQVRFPITGTGATAEIHRREEYHEHYLSVKRIMFSMQKRVKFNYYRRHSGGNSPRPLASGTPAADAAPNRLCAASVLSWRKQFRNSRFSQHSVCEESEDAGPQAMGMALWPVWVC